MSSTDDELMAELADVLRPRHQPPPDVLRAAEGVYAWRTIDAELAALTFDSRVDAASTTVRAASPPRFLTFEANGAVIEVELETSSTGRRLLGQLQPVREAQVELCAGPDVLAAAEADTLGRFILEVPPGARTVALRCRFDSGSIQTSAVTL